MKISSKNNLYLPTEPICYSNLPAPSSSTVFCCCTLVPAEAAQKSSALQAVRT